MKLNNETQQQNHQPTKNSLCPFTIKTLVNSQSQHQDVPPLSNSPQLHLRMKKTPNFMTASGKSLKLSQEIKE